MKTRNNKSDSPFLQIKWEYVASGIFIRFLDKTTVSVLSTIIAKDVGNPKVNKLIDRFYSQVSYLGDKSTIPEAMYRGLVASGYNYSPSKFLKKGEAGTVSNGAYCLDVYEEAHMLFFYLTQAGVPCSLDSVLPETIGTVAITL